jgi:ligand-binding SRPBCC domain-containing protein
MKIKIKTKVNQDYRKVFPQFGLKLFMALKPPFLPVILDRFDGSKKHDQVHMTINLIFKKEKWITVIIDEGEKENELYFIDVGKVLPFFLTKWIHKHRIIKNGNGSIIIDDIFFKTPNPVLGIFFYIIFLIQFFYRKPVYKKYFK